MKRLAELYVKRDAPYIGLDYYEKVLPLVDEDDKKAIQEIINSLRQELELPD